MAESKFSPGQERLLLRWLYEHPEDLAKVPRLPSAHHDALLQALRELRIHRPHLERIHQMVDGDGLTMDYLHANFELAKPVNEADGQQLLGEYSVFCALDSEDPDDDAQDLILGYLADARRAMRQAELYRWLQRTHKITMSRATFGRRIAQMLDEGLIYREDPASRKSPLTLERPVLAEAVSLADPSLEADQKKRYPILPFLNEEMEGGIEQGKVFLFNAMSGLGKSYFYLAVAARAVEHGLRTLYIDLENTGSAQRKRLEHITGVSTIAGSVYERLAWMPFAGGKITRATLEQVCSEYDVVILDYLKNDLFSAAITSGSGFGAPGSSILQEISAICRDTDTIFVSGTQVKRKDYSTTRTPYVELQGGNSWLQPAPDAWSVFFSEEDERYIYCRFRVEKARDRERIRSGQIYGYAIDKRTAQYSASKNHN